MKSKIFFLIVVLSLPFLSLRASVAADPAAMPNICQAPAWIKPINVTTSAIPLKPSQVNFQCLLIDTQKNWEDKTTYHHRAIKAVTNRGVEAISQLQIDFDPSFTQVKVHAISIFRNGAWHDRLANARFQLLQRETALESNLYCGELTLVYFLSDIRKGDILEYSYSLVGTNPLFSSHFSDMVDMQREIAVEKISYRLLATPQLHFTSKPFNTDIEPKSSVLSRTVKEWVWEDKETEPCDFWDKCACIQLSGYEDWEKLAQTVYPLFVLPKDFTTNIPPEMHVLVQKWKETAYRPMDRALLALRFVQDEIRYFGIEEGVGGWKPRDPRMTFMCRFGDCKDKSFLLHALLRLMDISSTPLVVNANRGDTLPDMLPSPYLFNHAVLQIRINGNTYYVDPTISLQGGSLETNAFPEYYFGLLMADHTKNLVELPEHALSKPAEINTSFASASQDTIKIQIRTTFYNLQADMCRQLFTWEGAEAISLSCLTEIQDNWGPEVAIDAPIEFHDDRYNNVITIFETYILPVEKYWASREALFSIMRSRIQRISA